LLLARGTARFDVAFFIALTHSCEEATHEGEGPQRA
jgi:hypothetical protein